MTGSLGCAHNGHWSWGQESPWNKRKTVLRGGPTETRRPRGETKVRFTSFYPYLPNYQISLPVPAVWVLFIHCLVNTAPNSLAAIHSQPATGSALVPPTSITPPRPKNGPCLPSQALAPPSTDVLLWRFPVLKLLLNPIYFTPIFTIWNLLCQVSVSQVLLNKRKNFNSISPERYHTWPWSLK